MLNNIIWINSKTKIIIEYPDNWEKTSKSSYAIFFYGIGRSSAGFKGERWNSLRDTFLNNDKATVTVDISKYINECKNEEIFFLPNEILNIYVNTIDFLIDKGMKSLDILGWSWGATFAKLIANIFSEKVIINKLFLLAPTYNVSLRTHFKNFMKRELTDIDFLKYNPHYQNHFINSQSSIMNNVNKVIIIFAEKDNNSQKLIDDSRNDIIQGNTKVFTIPDANHSFAQYKIRNDEDYDLKNEIIWTRLIDIITSYCY